MRVIISYTEPIEDVLTQQKTVRDIYNEVLGILYDEDRVTITLEGNHSITIQTKMIKNFVVENY